MIKQRNIDRGKQLLTEEITPSYCIAKTRESFDGSIEKGLTVEQHSVIAGLVARALISLYPESLKRDLFPPGFDFRLRNQPIRDSNQEHLNNP